MYIFFQQNFTSIPKIYWNTLAIRLIGWTHYKAEPQMQFPNCKQLSNLIWWPTWKTNYVRKAKSISRVFGWVGYLFIYLFFQVGGFGPCGITNKIAYFSSVNTWLPLSTIPHIECSNFGKFLGSEYAFLIFLHSLIFFSHEKLKQTKSWAALPNPIDEL